MTKKTIIKDLEVYLSTLDYIDKKLPLLEYSEHELITYKKQLDKLTHQFSPLNMLIYWAIFTLIALIPMSLLNLMIDTSFNFLYITPLFSAIVLLLYKNKTANTTLKKQSSGIKKSLKQCEEKFNTIAGEINYSKSLAEEFLSKLLLSKEKLDLLSCEEIYTNDEALNYSLIYIEQNDLVTFSDAINRFKTILDEIQNDSEKTELINDYNKAKLKIQYSKGALKRCSKVLSSSE